MHKNIKIVGFVILLITLIVIPFFLRDYYLYISISFLINVIVVSSFRTTALTGIWNLAHIAIMGLGAYTTAMLTTTYNWSFWTALPIAGLVSLIFAILISYPLVKITGFALFIAAAAVGEAVRLSWTKLRFPFRGHEGFVNIQAPESFFGIDFSKHINYYFLVLVIVAVCLWIMYRLEFSRIGDTFKAINLDDVLSRSVGINIRKYKMLAMVLGSFFVGIAGALAGHHWGAVDPSSFSFVTVMYLVVWARFGGIKTFVGSIIGLFTLTFVKELLKGLEAWIPFFYGIILIITILFLPDGLESIPKRISSWRIKRRSTILRKLVNDKKSD